MGVNEIGSTFHKKREAEKLGKWGGKKKVKKVIYSILRLKKILLRLKKNKVKIKFIFLQYIKNFYVFKYFKISI